MSKDLMKLTAVELGKKIKDKEVTVVEATKACLERIKALDETYNCFVTVDEAGALAQAEAVQAKIDSGELTGPLAGVPVAIKDNMCINGMLTSCSSKILSNFVPTYTATAVEKLQEAGAVIIGKTNMDEFAMGSTTETSAYGLTKNPWNTQHVPGGSSGGSCGKPRHNKHKKYPTAVPRDTFCSLSGTLRLRGLFRADGAHHARSQCLRGLDRKRLQSFLQLRQLLEQRPAGSAGRQMRLQLPVFLLAQGSVQSCADRLQRLFTVHHHFTRLSLFLVSTT